ncbi:undecaprenyldiphospho-muramoylpentapeptide beta-N-acetylglucosaminyltransferase [Cyanobacterium sp. uoEpiScrs1]|uniref:undecaprenyldiphospho-muramoylpentapeptide beta-N-acetylglucosaminyltransferase n=1 Tax=Cyanobacterium sp. uoEpiScrs1 TaxID=2976343 RepID=UPI002269FEBC|nr:undecaprenyldiphospho-muramoylpentapeptide beta-N-acetylglucosaminyltransferase [Cyanobacterium sp. uoEpiScrs1]
MIRLLIAASGTGGHLFPALALAEHLPDYHIEWLGVRNRLEQTLVTTHYPLHLIDVEGFQNRNPIKIIKVLFRLIKAVFQVKKIIKEHKIDMVFTTGGYIAAPAILAARLSGIKAIIHESNFIPGKVTRLLSRVCDGVALGFKETAQYLPNSETIWVSTPVRSQFYTPQLLDLPIPDNVPLIVVVGGSQGAVPINNLVRKCANSWLSEGAYIVHLTGTNDPNTQSLQHPYYLPLHFYDNMAGLLQRANLAVSRAGAGILTELAITKTPAILIPYPFAAENHQVYNAQIIGKAGAALVYHQEELTTEILKNSVLKLLRDCDELQKMANKTESLAVFNSAQQLAKMIEQMMIPRI